MSAGFGANGVRAASMAAQAAARGWGAKNKRQWHLTAVRRYPDCATARGEAARIARTHQPENPASPVERMVLCSGPDDYLVALKGRLGGVFHVRVHVWEVVGLYEG